jgi:hypothetical protein
MMMKDCCLHTHYALAFCLSESTNISLDTNSIVGSAFLLLHIDLAFEDRGEYIFYTAVHVYKHMERASAKVIQYSSDTRLMSFQINAVVSVTASSSRCRRRRRGCEGMSADP